MFFKNMFFLIMLYVTAVIIGMEERVVQLPKNYQETLMNFDIKNEPFDMIKNLENLALRDKIWHDCLQDAQCTKTIMTLLFPSRPLIGAIVLNTAGAIAYVKRSLEQNPKNIHSIDIFLTEISRCRYPDLLLVKKILDNIKEIQPTALCALGGEALITAAAYNRLALVQLLVAYNVSINSRAIWDGRTPLMVAALNGYTNIVKYLIMHKADVNTTDCSDANALHLAAHYAHVDVAKELIIARADIQALDEDNRTPLFYAGRVFFPQYQARGNAIAALLQGNGTLR